MSVSPQLDEALSAAADRLGVTKSQVALQAVMLGLPGVLAQVEAVTALRTVGR